MVNLLPRDLAHDASRALSVIVHRERVAADLNMVELAVAADVPRTDLYRWIGSGNDASLGDGKIRFADLLRIANALEADLAGWIAEAKDHAEAVAA